MTGGEVLCYVGRVVVASVSLMGVGVTLAAYLLY